MLPKACTAAREAGVGLQDLVELQDHAGHDDDDAGNPHDAGLIMQELSLHHDHLGDVHEGKRLVAHTDAG